MEFAEKNAQTLPSVVSENKMAKYWENIKLAETNKLEDVIGAGKKDKQKKKKKTKKKKKKKKNSNLEEEESPSETLELEEAFIEIDSSCEDQESTCDEIDIAPEVKEELQEISTEIDSSSEEKELKFDDEDVDDEVTEFQETSNEFATSSEESELTADAEDIDNEVTDNDLSTETQSDYNGTYIDIEPSEEVNVESNNANNTDSYFFQIAIVAIISVLLLIFGVNATCNCYYGNAPDQKFDSFEAAEIVDIGEAHKQKCTTELHHAIDKLMNCNTITSVDEVYDHFLQECENDSAEKYISEQYTIFCDAVKKKKKDINAKEKKKLADTKTQQTCEIENLMDEYLTTHAADSINPTFDEFVKYLTGIKKELVTKLSDNHQKFLTMFSNKQKYSVTEKMKQLKLEIVIKIQNKKEKDDIKYTAFRDNYALNCQKPLDAMLEKLVGECKNFQDDVIMKQKVINELKEELKEEFDKEYQEYRGKKIEEEIDDYTQRMSEYIYNDIKEEASKRTVTFKAKEKNISKMQQMVNSIKSLKCNQNLQSINGEQYKNIMKELIEESHTSWKKMYRFSTFFIEKFQKQEDKCLKLMLEKYGKISDEACEERNELVKKYKNSNRNLYCWCEVGYFIIFLGALVGGIIYMTYAICYLQQNYCSCCCCNCKYNCCDMWDPCCQGFLYIFFAVTVGALLLDIHACCISQPRINLQKTFQTDMNTVLFTFKETSNTVCGTTLDLLKEAIEERLL